MELGLERDGRVVLNPFSSKWAQAYLMEENRLSRALNHSTFKFFHIGSTSIPEMAAKPILDILLTVPSLEILDETQNKFESLGYEYKGEYGIAGRRYCVLYSSEKTKGYVHLHAFLEKSPEAETHLLFRDFLRARPEVAKEYKKMKLRFVNEMNLSRETYSESKGPFIKKILEDAMAWKKIRKL